MTSLSVFKNRRVLVTGHTGFKGSWLALWLHRLGAQVTGLALAPDTTPSNFELAHISEVLEAQHLLDVRDGVGLRKAFDAAQPEVVFHLAAQSLVRKGYAEPRETFEINVNGTLNVLEAVRLRQAPCVVLAVTSDKCYENQEQIWGYRECDPMGGHDPYSASKGAAELIVSSYRRSFFNPAQLARHRVKLASARAGNVIGGGDWAADRIVTDAIKALREGREIPVRNPKAIRPWQHVLEPLNGYLELAARMLGSDEPHWCSGWNFGPRSGEERTVAELMQLLCLKWGEGTWKDVSDPNQPQEARTLRLSIDKATMQLGWQPRWNLETTVQHTAYWYKQCLEGKLAAREACLNDLQAYEKSKSA